MGLNTERCTHTQIIMDYIIMHWFSILIQLIIDCVYVCAFYRSWGLFIYPLIHYFNQHLLRAWYMSGTVSAVEKKMNKMWTLFLKSIWSTARRLAPFQFFKVISIPWPSHSFWSRLPWSFSNFQANYLDNSLTGSLRNLFLVKYGNWSCCQTQHPSGQSDS